jgi:hypothetical protein
MGRPAGQGRIITVCGNNYPNKIVTKLGFKLLGLAVKVVA